MMTFHELSIKSGASLKVLRKLDTLGALKVERESETIQALRFHMARNQTFSLPMLLQMLDEPDLVDELELGSRRYGRRAREQIAALGDFKATQAPLDVTAILRDAARGDVDACVSIGRWLVSVLPSDPVPHHWVAVRLLAPLNKNLRDQNSGSIISLALLNLRKLPQFAAYWKSEKVGARNVIKYARPEKIPLDL